MAISLATIGQFGQSINEIYGQTECNLVLETCVAAGIYRKGAIGKAVPGHAVALLGEDGEPVEYSVLSVMGMSFKAERQPSFDDEPDEPAPKPKKRSRNKA